MAVHPEIREKILELSSKVNPGVIELRRHFHRYPELSYQEFLTSTHIARWLKSKNIPFRENIAGTGIIATIKGKAEGGRIIGVRAEMDALPVNEKNITGYESMNPGKMHACGHDAHMAMLMGTAELMSNITDKFGGTILLIFQPGEEKNPGGARMVIESGAFDEIKPDLFIGQHILPELEIGKTGYISGIYMASCDEIYITVKGIGGHAALPGLTTDQIYIASNLVVRLKNRMSQKQAENQIPTVLGIGRIIGEGATNVIPEKVEIAGTFRTFNEKWRAEAQDLIRSIASETAAEYGVTIDVKITEGYPVLVNDEQLTAKAISLSSQLLGGENVEIYTANRMSSDDFSFYSSIAPSLYYRIGIRKKGAEPKKLHTAEFDIDENGLATGVANLSWLLYSLLTDRD
jgi:amidohydrolase